ncbi:UDP-N-acetylglucosamine-N-acetylmuramylpentapeptide N-acetylglucosamine transferase [Lishizhenia tianjinensis]|uniref:UDP-N-acetylglucosamine--N-acetylmuramyl-(pentapeptide) pyrophosphoryl-undecaprenol N-acetylglucosamine transferase n=1 Tax=Lishizhenia tianjinensis TaxID=477690 RepID=A0A1I6ZZ11_9FLAO|nr:undecaprenyldiphospho-muramoylpentapeptide beta-N-acetylglucosaminyltransferase [Lishizhenia tianjinensis]SFT67930.1 UDP-N-acetylglucosamine-N-acetylmuramylpentapeptide N-acetylglucosamine transferase [Lishizhenia tianjinensis]
MIQKAIISGGGTGGHIFPAVAIANGLKEQNPNIEILFVGAEGKMEMEKVPAAGYKIIGLPIRGLQRKLTLSNLALPFKILKSYFMAKKIIKDFKPDVVVGVGGYASAPTLIAATRLGVPSVVQEQNSFPGKTNIYLSKKVNKICVAHKGLERFFPANKIVFTGNPVRTEVAAIEGKRELALKSFNLSTDKQTILVLGGSLGALTLNNSVQKHLDSLHKADVQVIWQCGKFYKERLSKEVDTNKYSNIVLTDFIPEMQLAYAAADVIISRAGALSVSEIALVGKPSILVPSPNVAEDHQTHNANSLVNEGAALLVKDNTAVEELIPLSLQLLNNPAFQNKLKGNLKALARPNATQDIVQVLMDLKA